VNIAVKEMELLKALEAVLQRVPGIGSLDVEREVDIGEKKLDAVVHAHLSGLGSQRWVVELKSRPVEPNLARLIALDLGEAVAKLHADYAVLVAPFVSERSAEILKEAGVGHCDLSGNCYLASGPLLVDRSGRANAFARQARHRSLFTAGAERVLRAVLDPAHVGRGWTVRELAEAAWPGISIGHAHKVAKALETQEFLRRDSNGLAVKEPEKLLGAWAVEYRANRNEEHRYYSPHHGDELRERFTELVTDERRAGPLGAIASFSAAELLAPHVRQHRFFAYWLGDLSVLERRLELKAVGSGENVVVRVPYDEGVLYPSPESRLPVTCPVQTYVDLRSSSGRGEEAAQAVFDALIREAYSR